VNVPCDAAIGFADAAGSALTVAAARHGCNEDDGAKCKGGPSIFTSLADLDGFGGGCFLPGLAFSGPFAAHARLNLSGYSRPITNHECSLWPPGNPPFINMHKFKNYSHGDPNQEVGGRDLYAGGSCRHIPRELFGHTSGTSSYLENKYEHEDHAFG